MKLKTNLENWLNYDTNPLIVFSNNARVLYANEAGEYLLSFVSPKQVYDMIINYAPKEKGFEFVSEKFLFGDFGYSHAMIGYDNYDEIGVRFYKTIEPSKNVDLDNLEKVNIYFLIDLARTYTFIEKEIEFVDLFDPDLPEIRCDKNRAIKLFSTIYELLKDNKTIKTEVKIKIGEYIKLNNKKYKLLEVDIYANDIKEKDLEFENITITFFENKISLLIPLIDK